MGIRAFMERLKENKNKYKAYEEEMRIAEKYEERKLSSNERELQRFMKEKREDSIKKELEEWRKKKQKDTDFGHQILKTGNMFEPKKNDSTILKQKNMFANERSMFMR